MKQTVDFSTFFLKSLDHKFGEITHLKKSKILLGSSPQCDVHLSHPDIAEFHVMIHMNELGLEIKDLFSDTGFYINGTRLKESFVCPGDMICFGSVCFLVEQSESVASSSANGQRNKKVSAPEFLTSPRPGSVLVDGDFCMINFDDQSFNPLLSSKAFQFQGEFTDLDNIVPEQAPPPVTHQIERLEVISYLSGFMMDVKYFDLNQGECFLDGQKFCSLDGQNFNLYLPNDFLGPRHIELKQLQTPIFYSRGVEQISIRLTHQTYKWKSLPWLTLEENFKKEASRVFAATFLPLLLLLLIKSQAPVKPIEEIAVVYKLPEKVQLSQTEVSKAVTEPATAKSSQSSAVKSQRSDSAKSPSPSSVAGTTQTVAKSYDFDVPTEFSAMESSAGEIKVTGHQGQTASSAKGFKLNAGANSALASGQQENVGKLGKHLNGQGLGERGARGLATKSGFDNAFLEPKTVVLGSMDPELLRKILQEYLPQFRHCYQQELVGQSDKIKGIIDLNFTIGPQGRVAKHEIKIKDARFSQKGVNCMGQVLALIDFPRPKGGGLVDVRQPLNFFAETEKI